MNDYASAHQAQAAANVATVTAPYTVPYGRDHSRMGGEDIHFQEWKNKKRALEHLQMSARAAAGDDEGGSATFTPALANQLMDYAAQQASFSMRAIPSSGQDPRNQETIDGECESAEAQTMTCRVLSTLGEFIRANPAIIADQNFASKAVDFSERFPWLLTTDFVERSEAAANPPERPAPERVRSVFGPRANGGNPRPA